MAAEPSKFELIKDGDFDGVTEMSFERRDFIVRAGRIYTKLLSGPAGIIKGDFFGTVADLSPKAVSIGSRTWNPYSVARLLPGADLDVFREEIDLSPQMATVLMYPGDRLAIFTFEEERAEIQIVVNELTEGEHVRWALAREPASYVRRYRIIRDNGTGFSHTPTATTWQPNYAWDASRNLMVATEVASGVIPARNLCAYPRFQGCYLSVRFSGIGGGNGKLFIVDGQLREADEFQGNIKNGEWSKVAYISHDDHVGIQTPSPPGGTVVCDLELVRVQPGDRLSRRYAAGL